MGSAYVVWYRTGWTLSASGTRYLANESPPLPPGEGWGEGAQVNVDGVVKILSLPGAARRLITFLASPRKVIKRRRPQFHHPFGVSCVARQLRRLRNSHDPLRVHVLKQSSPTTPELPALLGGGNGEWGAMLPCIGIPKEQQSSDAIIYSGQ